MNGYAADATLLMDALHAALDDLPPDVWARRTGTRDRDWTLHETLAHVVSVAGLFNRAAYAGLTFGTFDEPGIRQRSDLAAWNTAQIAALIVLPPPDLLARLRAELDAAVNMQDARHDLDTRGVYLRIYNRPLPVRDVLDFQLSHLGAVHGAQLTRAQGRPPLWRALPPDALERTADRYMRHFSAAYWQGAQAPDFRAALNLHVGASCWHVAAAPDGGSARRGAAQDALYACHFADADTLFGTFGAELPVAEALASGRLRIDGDAPDALALLKCFAAAPPRGG